ncbi:MAG TPA: alpha/beta hydrolase, partial [bacterium]|nr:alpha/beta hydrolase [bacterium]
MKIETKRSFYSRTLFAVAIAVVVTCLNGAAYSAGLKVEKNILLDTPGGVTIAGDVYIPQGKGPFPGVVFFHGGGFVGGSKDDAAIVSYVGKVAEKGYVVFNANYRLLLENGLFPNNVKDAKCALSWFRSNATRYGVDPKRIGAMGESAGAYLAAMLAVRVPVAALTGGH